MDSRELQRLRLEQAAKNLDFEGRVAHAALAQFNEQQRALDEAELTASKRRIQELESIQQPKSKKQKQQHVLGKLDQSLTSFGFTGGGQETAATAFFCSICKRGFTSRFALSAHARAQKSECEVHLFATT